MDPNYNRPVIVISRKMSNFIFSYIMARTSYIRQDDYDVHPVLDQHA